MTIQPPVVQAVDPDHVASRVQPIAARGPDGVTLTTSTVVDQMAFSNNCGVPLAALVDFVPPAALQLPQISRQPQRCRSCAAYMNCYCKTDLGKGMWRCSFCGQAHVVKDFLGSVQGHCPELMTEAVEYVFPAPPPSATPPRPAHVVVAVDATADEDALQSLRVGVLEALSSLDRSTRVSVLSFDSVVSLHHLGGQPTAESSEPSTSSTAFSLTLPGSRPLDPTLLSTYITGAVRGPGGCKAVLHADMSGGLQHIEAALRSIRPLESDRSLEQRPRCLGVAVEAALHLLAICSSGSEAGTRVPRGSRLLLLSAGPCTQGPASVSVSALEAGAGFNPKAAGVSKEERQQVAAADKFVAGLVETATSRGVPVDVVLGGSLLVHAPLLSQLARDTHGLLLVHRGFGPCLGPSLKAGLGRCFGTSAVLDCYVSDGLRLVQWLGHVEVLQAPEPEDVGLSMATDRRLSSCACSVNRLQQGQGAALRLEVVRNLEPPAVLIQVVIQFVDPSIGGRLVQRITTRRLAVVSRIPDFLAGVNAEAAAAVVAKKAVLDAKKAGALWSTVKWEEFRYSLRAQLSLIASRCGREVQLSGGLLGFGVRKARSLPQELLPLATSLYQLQRPGAALLGRLTPSAHPHWAQQQQQQLDGGAAATREDHPDARLLRANALLSAGARAALLMILPKLYWWQPSGATGQPPALEELPPVDLMPALLARRQQPGDPALVALQHAGSCVLALPIGPLPASAMPADALESLRVQVLAMSSLTWPAPELVVLAGPGGERELRALLVPLAGAKLSEVESLYPEILDKVDAVELAQLQHGLMAAAGGGGHKGGSQQASVESFVQWCQGAGVQVTPEWVQ